jgi:hypothetical protein
MNRKIRIALTAIWWTHRQVMRARFPMIAGLLAAVIFLLVPQGREILNVIAQPSVMQTELFRAEFRIFAATAGMNWGWIAAFWSSALALSLMCWGFSRVLLSLDFTAPGALEGERPLIGERQMTPWQIGLDEACASILPTVFGAVPLVAIGSGLLQNAQALTAMGPDPLWLSWFCRLYPLAVVFGIPLLILTVDAVARIGEDDPRKPSVAIRWLRFALPIALAIPIAVSLGCALTLPARRTCLEATAFFFLAFTVFGIKRVRPAVVMGIAIFGCTVWRAVSMNKGHGLLDFGSGDPTILPWQMAEIWMGLIGGAFAIAIPLAFVGNWKKPQPFGWLLASGIVYLGCVATLILSRTDVARWIGCGAVLMIGIGFWLCLLGGIQVFARKERVPWLAILAGWMAVCTLWNDNHRIRTVANTDAGTSPRRLAKGATASVTANRPPDVTAAYERWKGVPAIKAKLESGGGAPAFIIVTEGGGVRAAFWTATVLSALEDLAAAAHPTEERVFANHCFAISGVSGGSVGGTLFAAMNTTEHARPGSEALDILKEDLLSPLISGLVCNDWLQCALPFPVSWFDRGGRFEQNLEERFSTYLDSAEPNALAGPMLDLNRWRAEQQANWTPYLFLNSTNVEKGHRVIFSDVEINREGVEEFSDARDGHSLLSDRSQSGPVDLPLSSAAHNSARFPYTNPTGRMPGGGRLTDGGLFENSGATTGLEIARAIQRHEFAAAAETKAQVVLIVIRFEDPTPPAGWSVSGNLLHGLAGPLTALMSARTARATYATQALHAKMPRTDPSLANEVIEFVARTKRTMQPLGWQLSALAARDLYFQMPHQLVEGEPRNELISKNKEEPIREVDFDLENRKGAERVLELLAAPPLTKTVISR